MHGCWIQPIIIGSSLVISLELVNYDHALIGYILTTNSYGIPLKCTRKRRRRVLYNISFGRDIEEMGSGNN